MRELLWGKPVVYANNAARREFKQRGMVSVESMMDQDLDSAVAAHVITPGDLGAAAIANATASAFMKPESTVIGIFEQPDGDWTEAQRAELAGVKAVISLSKAPVFSDAASMAAYLADIGKR